MNEYHMRNLTVGMMTKTKNDTLLAVVEALKKNLPPNEYYDFMRASAQATRKCIADVIAMMD